MGTQPSPGQRALRRGRVSCQNAIYFVTATTWERAAWFRDFGCAAYFCRQLARPRVLMDSICLCYVLMPDHVHLLLQLGETPLDRVVNSLKSRSAVGINRILRRRGRFWSPGYYDHALRSEESLVGIARYIVANPLRAGLVRRVGDYPFWDAVWLSRDPVARV